MAFTHTNRRDKTYYLHTGPKRGGGVQHFLSTDPKGDLADVVPVGFEVYETVNGQVYLRRRRLSAIHDAELDYIRRYLTKLPGPMLHAAEVTGNMIVIHESENRSELDARLGAWRPGIDLEAIARQFAQYMPLMRFVLQDKTRRLFLPERYCFRGSVDRWIPIGPPDKIETLAAKFLLHLGRESFYELF
ncbi:MAG: hypothetical protein HY736_01065 [Verrucomicrobia bacterium]|nr:hypothetical protein [Verrucomicrobiota bacterium]